MALDRRRFLASAAVAPFVLSVTAQAQTVKEVKIAHVTPLSGPFARQGEYEKLGSQMAAEDINNSGGIHSLGGAKIKLIVTDGGESPERAKAAAQRLISMEDDLVAGTGAWLSAFTLAVSDVAERAKLPWVTGAWADSVTSRGFKYLVDTGPTASRITNFTIPTVVELAEKTTGKRPQTVAMITESGATGQATVAPLRNGGLEKLGLKAVMDENYTAPMSDATPLVQTIRRVKPDFLIASVSNIGDIKTVMEKLSEFGIGQGQSPVVGYGPQWGSPDLIKNIAKEKMQGVISSVTTWGSVRQKDLLDSMLKRTGEPWMTMDTLLNYAHIMLIKDAIERAGSTDRDRIAEMLRATDTTEGPAKYFLGDRLKFDENGRRVDAPVALIQWHDGVPVTVSPERDAVAKLLWPRAPA